MILSNRKHRIYDKLNILFRSNADFYGMSSLPCSDIDLGLISFSIFHSSRIILSFGTEFLHHGNPYFGQKSVFRI